jgi:hypothetical protein
VWPFAIKGWKPTTKHEHVLIKTAAGRQITAQLDNTEFHENPFSGCPAFTSGLTNLTYPTDKLWQYFITRHKEQNCYRFVADCATNTTQLTRKSK